jgi:tRNA pseudouridine55 synthase
MYSALKKQGQPLYKLARKGEVVERPQRAMTVYSLSFKRIDDTELQLDVHCSSGFYVRSLAHDLGQALGCGAHVIELRRTAIKTTDLSQAVTFEQLQAMESPLQAMQPIDCLLAEMPVLEISELQATSLLQGKKTVVSDASETPLSRLYIDAGGLFGIGKIDQVGQLKTQKMFILDN